MASLLNTIQTKLGELSTGAGTSKKTLLLGAGFVCKPTAQILADAGVEVTIGNLNSILRQVLTDCFQPAEPSSLHKSSPKA
jgi:alanine dehydrogenase